MLKSVKQIAQESGIATQLVIKCDFCEKEMDLSKDSWMRQEDATYIHLDCVAPALEEYKKLLDYLVPTKDPREPFLATWTPETCEWCGHISDSPFETHICKERV